MTYDNIQDKDRNSLYQVIGYLERHGLKVDPISPISKEDNKYCLVATGNTLAVVQASLGLHRPAQECSLNEDNEDGQDYEITYVGGPLGIEDFCQDDTYVITKGKTQIELHLRAGSQLENLAEAGK